MTRPMTEYAPAPGDHAPELHARIHAEYSEMPGLKLTLRQAARLFNLDVEHCQSVLSALVERGALASAGGSFVRADTGRRQI